MLQGVIATRDEEEKKNVVLMQLLNTQLEDQKARFEELLEDEVTKNASLQKEVLELKRQLFNVETEREKYVQIFAPSLSPRAAASARSHISPTTPPPPTYIDCLFFN